MTNENLDPPEADELFLSFYEDNHCEAQNKILTEMLDNDYSDLLTMEMPRLVVRTDEEAHEIFKKAVLELCAGDCDCRKPTDVKRYMYHLGAIWLYHIHLVVESESFQDLVDKEVCAMYEPDPDYGRDDA